MNWVDICVADYYNWLKDRTNIKKCNTSDWFRIETPCLDINNDMIEIYVKRDGDVITLSDDGETLYNLDLIGIDLYGSKARKSHFDSILLNYGVDVMNENKELIINTDFKNFSKSKFNFMNAITQLYDLSVMTKRNVGSMFTDDIKDYFQEKQIIATNNILMRGSSGLDLSFDYQIAGIETEILIKAFPSFKKDNVYKFLFEWMDVKDFRPKFTNKNLKSVVLINDIEQRINSAYTTALRSKDVDIILWSERNNNASLNKLRA